MTHVRYHGLAIIGALSVVSCDDTTIHISSGGTGANIYVSVDAAPALPEIHPVGVPVGPFYLPTGQFSNVNYSGAFRMLTPDSAVAIMDSAQAQFFDLFVNLAGPRENYQNPDGSFCLPCFKSRLDLYSGINFTPYVQSATVRGHILFDAPENPSLWGGTVVSYEDIDSAASYSRQSFPGLPVGVGSPPTFLVGGAPYAKLSFGFAQYSTDEGGLKSFIASELGAAGAAGLGTLFGLDVLSGNYGGPMTVDQVSNWGRTIACEPYALGILMWQYDSTYFADSAMQEASRAVVRLASFGSYIDRACVKNRD